MGEKKQSFTYKGKDLSIPMNDAMGKAVEIGVDGDFPLYANLTWQGIPIHPKQEKIGKKYALDALWYDTSGEPIAPPKISKQGDEFWVGLKFTSTLRKGVENTALAMILPSGWEVVNTRLTGEKLPAQLEKMPSVHLDYQDIRDDRVLWFFTMPRFYSGGDRPYVFAKLRAVSAGEFELPPFRLEAMYDSDYEAVEPGFKVRVDRE